jgi:hypothetical protein
VSDVADERKKHADGSPVDSLTSFTPATPRPIV